MRPWLLSISELRMGCAKRLEFLGSVYVTGASLPRMLELV